MLSDYILGVLYGDGYFQKDHRHKWFFFSTTHKELADRVKIALDDLGVHYFSHSRQFQPGHDNENYETLEIVEISDKKFREYLETCGFSSTEAKDRIKITSGFIRGYLETKGTLFQSSSRGNEFWRIALSGSLEDIKYLKNELESRLSIQFHNIVRRNEREHLGIISQSYRINIQNRAGLAKLIDFLDGEEKTSYLSQRIEGFNHFHKTTPFNLKAKVFKHYKYAVGYMARELTLDIRGVKHTKSIYMWQNDEPVRKFDNWAVAYKWISGEFKEKTGMNAPLVNELK